MSTTSSSAEWITVADYARHYSVAPRTVLRWINSTDMRVLRLGPGGRTIRIHRTELHSDSAPAA